MALAHSHQDTVSSIGGTSVRARRLPWRALLLIAPALFLVISNFVVPVGILLMRSFDSRETGSLLTRTSDALADWDGSVVPGETPFAALAHDLRDAEASNVLYVIALRLNAAIPGFNASIRHTVRELPEGEPASFKSAMIAIEPAWGDTAHWAAVKRATQPFTTEFLLAAVDLTIAPDGSIAMAPEATRVLLDVWLRTFWMASVITLISLFLGYPLAYALTAMPARFSTPLMVLVLVPFWTAALVRTTAWVVLLQNHGVINNLGQLLGLWAEPQPLLHTRFSTYVAMVHVLLPFMVLSLYAVMKRIPTTYLGAAASLGAGPVTAFRRVYLPLTLPGVGAGSVLVFILAVGLYFTPLLVGGASDQMISYYIAFYTAKGLNWGAAAALSLILLVLSGTLYFLLDRVFGFGRLQMTRV